MLRTSDGDKDPGNLDTFPRLYRFFESDSAVAEHERRLERRLKVLENRLEQTLNSARQIFAVAVDAVRELEPSGSKEKLEMYKVTLGRYHGLLI
jgi:hypothetical protein